MKLTDEQIDAIWKQHSITLGGWDHGGTNVIREGAFAEAARAVEAEVLRLYPVCCNRPTPDGECCGNPRPEQEQQACRECSRPSATPQQEQAAPGAVQDGWNPVSKLMPKSGQVVLALQTWDHSGKQSIIRACWISAKTEEANPESEIGEYDEATDTYWEPEGWYEQMSHWDEYSACAVNGAQVTHWMPLPAAPKAQEPGA